MDTIECEVLPRYTRAHFAHFKQVCDWYFDLNNFKDQLLAFHVDRTRHFHSWKQELAERKDIADWMEDYG